MVLALQAALDGDDLLATRFALSPPLDGDSFLERPEPWRLYQQHAAALLERAAAYGERHAVWALYRILDGQQHLRGMPRAIAPDARRAAVLAVALLQTAEGESRREFERAVAQARAARPAEEWPRIEGEGRDLAARHFAALPPHDFQRGVFDDVDASHCDG